MVDYQGNSNKSKEKSDQPEKNIEKVVVGEVVVKKPSLGAKFKRVFFGGDFHTAAEYVAAQVLLPALRDLFFDMVSRGSERLVYGETTRTPRAPGRSMYQPRVQYNSPVNRPTITTRGYVPDQPRTWPATASHKPFEDITLGTKDDAETVVENLIAIVEQYEIVSVADLYELVGLPSTHVDHKWGWTNLASISVSQSREGWTISFPPVEEIQ